MSQALWPSRSSWLSCFCLFVLFSWFSCCFVVFCLFFYIYIFFCFCFFAFFGFAPQGRMQRLESCHLFFSCQSMHMSKQRICKKECKKRTLTVPCSVFLWGKTRIRDLQTGKTRIRDLQTMITNWDDRPVSTPKSHAWRVWTEHLVS